MKLWGWWRAKPEPEPEPEPDQVTEQVLEATFGRNVRVSVKLNGDVELCLLGEVSEASLSMRPDSAKLLGESLIAAANIAAEGVS